ncbi:protein kinase, putative [Leishmania tarentolae]|uniref:Protein kinase, putative n=1 Tax=Leishmania tarentolae TaxID=5689 RepID=A0A640KAM9_LEITA|nr:protein kinase, putative [Leishmania tarentolae]
MLRNGGTLENLHSARNISETECSNSGSGSSTVGVNVRTSGGAGKFDKAMEMYQRSMAIRRRLTSTSSGSTRFLANGDGNRGVDGGVLTEDNTPAQTSLSSLHGPKLRSSARIIRAEPASSIVSCASPLRSQVLPETAPRVETRSQTKATASHPITEFGARASIKTSSPTAALMVHSQVSLSALGSAKLLPNPPDAERKTESSSSSSLSLAIPSRGHAKCRNGDQHKKADGDGSKSDAALRKDSLAFNAHLDSPHLFPTERQRMSSRHSSSNTSECFAVGLNNYIGDNSGESTAEAESWSALSFHQMMGRSYDVPALDTIFCSFSGDVDRWQQGQRLLRSPTHAATSAAAPTFSPSVSTSLQLSSPLIPKKSVPPPAAAVTGRIPATSVSSSAATTEAEEVHAMPAGNKGVSYMARCPSAQVAERKDRGSSSRADKARPEASGCSMAEGREGVHARSSLEPVKMMASALNFKPTEGNAPPLGLPLLDENSTRKAQFYSTASLAETFDGAQYLNDYILLNEIGSGSTGRVVLAFSTSMNKSVAIKIMQKPKEKPRLRRHVSTCSSASVLGLCSDSGTSGGEREVGTLATMIPKTMQNFNPPSSSAGRQSKRLKKPSASLTSVAGKARNLQREIEVMKDLNHPNIVRLYEVINDPKANSLFLILQYVDKGAVAQLDSTGSIRAPLQPWALLPIATQVSDGLVYLHEQHIVHRDIKPENILVNRNGQAFLADFGVAELMDAKAGQPTVATLAYQGTPLFMAPEIYTGVDDEDGDAEQAPGAYTRRKSSDTAEESSSIVGSPSREERHHRSVIDPFALDVWALGVTFYTLLIGHVPFTSMLQISQTVEKGVRIPTSLPAQWRTVLRRTMEPRQELRISSAELCHMLHAMLAKQEAREVGAGERSWKASLSIHSRNMSLVADTEEESVNLGGTSSSSSGTGTAHGSTSPSYFRGTSRSGDESGTSGHD